MQENIEINGADCLIGFAFGYRIEANHITPGLSNQDLADVIHQHYDQLPMILQHEIALALGGVAETPNLHVVSRHRIAGDYLDTHEVAAQAKAFMDVHSWTSAIIVAHPVHMPRAIAICQKLGIETIAASHLDKVRFDPKSAQFQTRDQASWDEYSPRVTAEDAAMGWL